MPKTKIPAEYISDNPSLSGTDSVKVPAGTTAQRGTGVAGKFRFNTTLNKFEGYTDSWGEIGGSGGSALETDNFTGDDSTTAFTLSSSVSDEDNLIVFIDGVYQNKADYVASGTTLTLDTAPLAGRKIVVYHVRANVSGSNCILNSFSGNGSTTAFTLTQNPASENNTQVFIDGVYQRKSSYAVSGTTLTFDAAPGNGTAIEVMMFTQTDINTLPASFVSGLTEVTAVGADHMMIFDATDSALKKALVSDVIEGTTTTINNNADNRLITGSGTANTLNGEAAATFDSNGVLKIFTAGNNTNGGSIMLGPSTDDATKYGIITAQQYDSGTETEGFGIIGSRSINTSQNHIYIGGDIGEVNAATQITFFTAANTTTRGGTERMRINSDGQLAVGNTGFGTGVIAYDRDVGAPYWGMNVTENSTYNDNSGHSFSSKHNTHGVIYIKDEGGNTGYAALPFYPNGGGGIAYEWNILDPDNGTWVRGNVGFGLGGSSNLDFTVAFATGSGTITVTRTAGSALYRVVIMEFAQQ